MKKTAVSKYIVVIDYVSFNNIQCRCLAKDTLLGAVNDAKSYSSDDDVHKVTIYELEFIREKAKYIAGVEFLNQQIVSASTMDYLSFDYQNYDENIFHLNDFIEFG